VPDEGTEASEHQGKADEGSSGFSPLQVVSFLFDEVGSLVAASCHKLSQELSNAEAVGSLTVRMGSATAKKQLFEFLGLTKTPQAPPSTPGTSSPPATQRSDPAAAAVIDAVIPGYDDLSASQVIRLLDELDPAGLGAVDTHEAAHRARRTILNKVHQLQAPTHET
jgi:hypothetical protein